MEPIKKIVKQATTQIERERDHFAASLNITGTQMSVIDFLSNMPDYTASQNEIEQEFDIRRSTTTIMLQRMEKRGLIERITSPNDKRQKLVKLTEKAQTLVEKIHEYMKQDDLKLRANFTNEELEITRKVLELIKNG
ncbi:MarR family transcriptional regulator [uncultured Lactobacillus sp.]|uniref:MarR family winged helix-turn-helix transcriptional regulator n=1 Tax=uncultured Lactobacillus sp. TaxID=153152 RepID=UPI002804DC88|nr:MarR family transcriptional regulator [uncultured Lactobacillus sp.]